MHLFFTEHLSGEQVSLSAEESAHALRVLRLKAGDQVMITDGCGTMGWGNISDISTKSCVISIDKLVASYQKRPYKLHIAVGPTKNIDRYEWFLEKATELGIDRITPLLCDHSERKIVKQERSEKVVIGAVKQSQKAFMPVVDEMTSFKDFIKEFEVVAAEKYIAHCEDEASKVELRDLVRGGSEYVMLVGPEGDFSDAEVALAHAAGFRSVGLGQARLRTETAALYCAMVAAIKN